MSEFKVGDRVRRKASAATGSYRVGRDAFEIQGVHNGYFIDQHGGAHGAYSLVLAPEPVIVVPPIEEYDSPIEEAVIRRTEGLQAVLRKRNEQIQADRIEINALRTEVDAKDAQLLERQIAAAATDLDKIAAQAGLTNEQAEQAVEIGAYAVAVGIDGADIRAFYSTISRFNGKATA